MSALLTGGTYGCTEIRQYGLSHADLARILPRFLPGTKPTCRGNIYYFALAEGQSVRLSLGPELERRLGHLKMPYVDLTFEYAGLDEQQRIAFRARFDRSFQKGGG